MWWMMVTHWFYLYWLLQGFQHCSPPSSTCKASGYRNWRANHQMDWIFSDWKGTESQDQGYILNGGRLRVAYCKAVNWDQLYFWYTSMICLMVCSQNSSCLQMMLKYTQQLGGDAKDADQFPLHHFVTSMVKLSTLTSSPAQAPWTLDWFTFHFFSKKA